MVVRGAGRPACRRSAPPRPHVGSQARALRPSRGRRSDVPRGHPAGWVDGGRPSPPLPSPPLVRSDTPARPSARDANLLGRPANRGYRPAFLAATSPRGRAREALIFAATGLCSSSPPRRSSTATHLRGRLRGSLTSLAVPLLAAASTPSPCRLSVVTYPRGRPRGVAIAPAIPRPPEQHSPAAVCAKR